MKLKNKIKITKSLLVLFLLTVPCSLLSAFDFGFITSQYAEYGEYFEYSGGFIPRFSTLIGENGNLYISGSFTLVYNEDNDEPEYYPELLRTEYTNRFGAFGLKIGRIGYTDPLTFIAGGLFDGIQFNRSSSAGRFNISALYSGFQYKESADIIMTQNDQASYNEKFEYDDFANTYFASRRLLASFDWEYPALMETLNLKASLLGQVDLNDVDSEEKYHSGYLILKAGLPAGNVLFEAGGALQVSSESDFALAGELGIIYRLPAAFTSRLSLNASYSSGKSSESFVAFIPITTKYYGNIFQARLTGLSVIALNYSARFIDALGVNINASYFIRNDIVTANNYPYSSNDDGYFLGPEFSGSIVWNPVSDLQINLGAGAFVPAMGDNWNDEDLLWKVSMTMILAIR